LGFLILILFRLQILTILILFSLYNVTNVGGCSIAFYDWASYDKLPGSFMYVLFCKIKFVFL